MASATGPHELTKFDMDGTETVLDLGVPTEVLDIAYHPDGLHIAAVVDGAIWMVDNQGADMGALVTALAPTKILDIQFSASGSHLWFIGAHDGHRHLHVADLEEASQTPDEELDAVLTPLDEDQGTAVSHPELRSFVLDPYDPTRAATVAGPCEAPRRIVAHADGRVTHEFDGHPIGFIGGGRALVITEYSPGCAAGGLGVVDLDDEERPDPIWIADDVTAADIRDDLPAPTFTLEGVTLAGFT